VTFGGVLGTVVSASDADMTVVVASPVLTDDGDGRSLGNLDCALMTYDGESFSFVFQFLTTNKDPAISKLLPLCECGGVGDTVTVTVNDIGSDSTDADVPFYLDSGASTLVECEKLALATTRVEGEYGRYSMSFELIVPVLKGVDSDADLGLVLRVGDDDFGTAGFL
jgi:hypothetical protein